MSYTEEEVAFANSEITLAGTLTLPEGPASCPAVVLLQGSGPLNRDEELFGRKPFAIIADFFARNGIAVLRYDSRGVGGSTGAPFQYTLSDVAEDALAALRYMKARDEIDAAQIGLCGHSQGGIVAPICAARSDDVAFIICVAGIGTTGEETFLSQVRSVAVADGESEDRIDMRVRSMKRILELIRGGAGRAELEPEVLKVVQLDKPPMPVAADGPRNDGDVDGKSEADRESRITGNERAESDSEDAVRAELSCHLDLFSSPWFRSFLDHDAQPVLESVRCPALLVFGELDMQVPPNVNHEAMVGALKRGANSDFLVRTFPNANHGFQSAKTGSPSEYANLSQEFVPGFLELMSDWIHAKSR